jgi:hypothetical protein
VVEKSRAESSVTLNRFIVLILAVVGWVLAEQVDDDSAGAAAMVVLS